MTDLDTLVEVYKREVAVPGTFTAIYPDTTDTDISNALADAFAQAQLDGWFGDHTLDLTTQVVTPDLSSAGTALVVVYAGMRTVRAMMVTLKTGVRYKAGSVEYETNQSPGVLVELLRDLTRRRDELLVQARAGARATWVLDGYTGRLQFAPGELPGAFPELSAV